MTFCQTCLKNFTINLLSIAINLFAKDGSSNLIWYGLLRGKNYREYCNKQALICNKLRIVSKIGGDTPSHKASVFVKLRRDKSAVQAQVLSEKSEQVSNFILFWCGS